jgi:hypothetical protein
MMVVPMTKTKLKVVSVVVVFPTMTLIVMVKLTALILVTTTPARHPLPPLLTSALAKSPRVIVTSITPPTV